MRIETHPVLQKIICNNRTNGGKILNKEKEQCKIAAQVSVVIA
jgi:hypothetical protein